MSKLLQLLDFERTVDGMLKRLVDQGRDDLVPEDCPYFGQIWASSRSLATLLDTLDLQGKTVLEIGCGLALPSLVASRRGAECMALDIHPDVEEFLRNNMTANALERPIQYHKADWRSFAANAPFDFIIGSDILYENDHPIDVARFLNIHLKDAGCAIIVDPCRWHHLEFARLLENEGLTTRGEYSVDEEEGKITKIFTLFVSKRSHFASWAQFKAK